ncbi:MAG: DUF2087 domain-containing protein [Clostridiales bacterium]
MNKSDIFINSTLDELKKGYRVTDNFFECIICNKKFEKGMIFSYDNNFYECEKFVKIHIETDHTSVFNHLLNLDKKLNGLTDQQKNILEHFYMNKKDSEIQKDLKLKSSSTIRGHRFNLKEKEFQAKIFLTLMELLKDKNKKFSYYVEPHKTAKMLDNRYDTKETEELEILNKYFNKGLNEPLITFSTKEKNKIIILKHIIKKFSKNKIYTEKEVNEILKNVYEDFATIRRYLIGYGYMERTKDCSKYWLKDTNKEDENTMDDRKKLKLEYKELKSESGIYIIKNLNNNRFLLITTTNFKTINGKKYELNMGTNKFRNLQKDWEKFGEDNFEFKILETLEDDVTNKRIALKDLKEKWYAKLDPEKKIRY